MKSKKLALVRAVLLAVVVLSIAACSDGGVVGPPTSGGKLLKSFSSCSELNAALNAASVSLEEWEMDGRGGMGFVEGEEVADMASPEGETTEGSPAQATPQVEEADIAKEDGAYLYVLHSSGKLVIFDARDPGEISRIGEIDVGTRPIEMVVKDDMAAIIGRSSSSSGSASAIYLVDVTDRFTPSLVRTVELDGSYIDSRLVGGTFHIITSENLSYGNDRRPMASELMPNVRETRYSAAGATNTSSVSTSCSNIYIPDPMRFDSYGDTYPVKSTRITSFSIGDPEAEVTNTVVAAMWPTVAASPSHLFLADWDRVDDTTALHVFDIASDPNKAVLEDSTSFEGLVLNQFSIDEHDNMIRVAVTTNRNTFGSDDNDNRVLVFYPGSAGFVELGRVENITPGESIWSARFMGERAFLVTFLTIDPLITVDLSDPQNPFVAGELEVPGVSTHIVPMDEDHLLTVGFVDSSSNGVALQIFDVSDFANPQLAHRIDIVMDGDGYSSSEATQTHKALSYFAEEGLVALPMESRGWETVEDDSDMISYQSVFRSEMQIYHVDLEVGFTEAGIVEHSDLISDGDGSEDFGRGMRRALMVGETLFTVSDYGLKAFGLTDFAEPLFSDYMGIDW